MPNETTLTKGQEAPAARLPMPLMRTAFEPGRLACALAAIESAGDPDLATIARAEAAYFTASPEDACREAEPYLEDPDPGLRMSACFICAYANLSLNRALLAKKCLQNLASLGDDLAAAGASVPPEVRASYTLIVTAAAVLLHLPRAEAAGDLADAMRLLPEGLRLFAAYVRAHRAYLAGEHGRCVGLAEGALAMATDRYPISELFLQLVASMGCMGLKDTARAEDHFRQAWETARPDDLIEEVGEHHGLLQGVLETCLKESDPDALARVIKVTYRFSYGWRRIHNPETGDDVADDLTTTEFAMAMLACRGWSNEQIAAHMGVSRGTVKNRLSSVYAKLNISSRSELARHMLR